MRFNAAKCQVVQVTNKRTIIPATYTIHGHILETVKSAKYLGVHLDSKLSFNTHIDNITKRANRTRAFFSRNLCHTSMKVKEAIYTTFIRPTAEYAATSWDPHTLRNTKKIEQIQRSSARFVMGDYQRSSSVSSMIDRLGWATLEERRRQSRLHMMFKIRFNLVDIPWKNYLSPLSTTTRGHGSRFAIPHTNVDAYARSYFPRTIRDWNMLPINPAEYQTLDAFKTALRDLHH